MRPRSAGASRGQAPSPKALRAASTARSMSAERPSETSASGSSVAGLSVVKVRPSTDSTHCPPMKSRPGGNVEALGAIAP